MNCQSCNTRIDYRFATNCAHCGYETAQIDPSQYSVESIEESLTWKQRVLNLAYVLASAFAGLISGAVALYFLGALFYIAFLSNVGGNASDRCARGNAFAALSILLGAFLGTIGGSVFAVKKPLCK